MADLDRVLIVGGGPVGALAGLSLAQRGIPVTVIERLAEPPTDHRAATLQPSTLDLVAPLGLTAQIMEKGLCAPHFQWRDKQTGEVVAEFDYGRLSDISDHPFVIQLEQHKTVQIIFEEARKFSCFKLLRPVEVLAVRQSEDHVEVDVKHPAGEQSTLTGRYLVGCDGGRSLVRHATSVSFEGFTWQERFNIVTTKIDFATLKGFRYRNYLAQPERWTAVFKVPGPDDLGVWRAVFPTKASETDEEVMSNAWIEARFAELLPEGVPCEILHRNMYSVHQRVAGCFRERRFILAGDAAHINNPLGGMGMNSGFQDALNLCDKLEMIWNGADADPLLDLYDRQRRLTAVEFVQEQSISNKKMLEESDIAARRGRMEAMRKTAADPAAHHAFLVRSSLIGMLRRAEEIA